MEHYHDETGSTPCHGECERLCQCCEVNPVTHKLSLTDEQGVVLDMARLCARCLIEVGITPKSIEFTEHPVDCVAGGNSHMCTSGGVCVWCKQKFEER